MTLPRRTVQTGYFTRYTQDMQLLRPPVALRTADEGDSSCTKDYGNVRALTLSREM